MGNDEGVLGVFLLALPSCYALAVYLLNLDSTSLLVVLDKAFGANVKFGDEERGKIAIGVQLENG